VHALQSSAVVRESRSLTRRSIRAKEERPRTTGARRPTPGTSSPRESVLVFPDEVRIVDAGVRADRTSEGNGTVGGKHFEKLDDEGKALHERWDQVARPRAREVFGLVKFKLCSAQRISPSLADEIG